MAENVVGSLVFRVTGDTSGLKTGLKEARSEASTFGGVLSRLGPIIAAAFSVGAITNFVKSIIKGASDAQETAQKFGVVFAGVGKAANEQAKIISDSYNVSRTAAKEFLATTGSILVSFGFTKKEALENSAAVTKLAADLISFTNNSMGVAGASDAITKALLGEREQLKSLGVAITDNDLIAYAKAQGQVWSALDKRRQAEISLQLIMERTKLQQGDVARSTESFAYQMRAAENNSRNLREALGKSLLPVATLAVKTFNEMTKESLSSADAFNEWAKSAEGSRKIGSIMGGIAGALAGLKTALEPLTSSLGTIFKSFGEMFGRLAGSASKLSVVWQVLNGVFVAASIGIQLTFLSFRALFETTSNMILLMASGAPVVKEFFLAVTGRGDPSKMAEAIKGFKTAAVALKDGIKGNLLEGLDIFKTATKQLINNGQKAAEDAEKISAKTRESVAGMLSADPQEFEDTTSGGTKTKPTGGQEDKTKKTVESIFSLSAAWEDAQKKAEEAWKTMSASEKAQAALGAFSSGVNEISSLLSAASNLSSTLYQQRIDALDAQKQAELEAAGVAEDTAVEKAQAEYDAAVLSGDATLEEEKRKALARAKIDEKYAKQKAKLEYQMQLNAWQFQVAQAGIQLIMAPLNALASGFGAPAFMLPWFPIMMAGVAESAAALQFAAVQASKPKPPQFASGGIIPGSQQGTQIIAGENNNPEAVMNQAQMQRFMDIADGKASSTGQGNILQIYFGNEMLYQGIYDGTKNGQIQIHERAVVTK